MRAQVQQSLENIGAILASVRREVKRMIGSTGTSIRISQLAAITFKALSALRIGG